MEIEPDNVLAQVVKVLNIEPIPGADRIELATVLGWKVVVKKDEFHVGDNAIYFSIGSVLDIDNPEFKFLEGKQLKTRKMRGVISQGLLGSLSWLSYYNKDPATVLENDNVTSIMKVKKYVYEDEKDLYTNNSSTSLSVFPEYVRKTDEIRVQWCHAKLQELKNKNIVCTQKFDGTSTTYIYKNGEFIICGRNRIMPKPPFVATAEGESKPPFVATAGGMGTHYYEIAKKHDLENTMSKIGFNYAIQGEIIGPKINGNRHKLTERSYHVFNIWNIDSQCYMEYDDILSITRTLGLNTVKEVYRGVMKDEWLSVDVLLKLADEQVTESGEIVEGIVIKSDYGMEFPRISFKVISNKYLLKYDL